MSLPVSKALGDFVTKGAADGGLVVVVGCEEVEVTISIEIHEADIKEGSDGVVDHTRLDRCGVGPTFFFFFVRHRRR